MCCLGSGDLGKMVGLWEIVVYNFSDFFLVLFLDAHCLPGPQLLSLKTAPSSQEQIQAK